MSANVSSARRAYRGRPGDPLPDTPALGVPGPLAVGATTLAFVDPDRPDLSRPGGAGGAPARYDRPLRIELWYPARAGTQPAAQYRDALRDRDGRLRRFRFLGRAQRGAEPRLDGPPPGGAPYPLVIVSHGYPGSRVMMSYLTEQLASWGFVVAAIDHTDSLHGHHHGRFASTLAHRSADQLATLRAVAAWSLQPGHVLHRLADTDRSAVVGYSMGGYGALLSAGAGLERVAASRLAEATGLPAALLDELCADAPAFGQPREPRLRALVAMAPWGGPLGLWSTAALARVRVPALFVAGDADDVSGYRDGIRRLWAGCRASERWLLVYQNARHNIAPNPPPPATFTHPAAYDHYAEPVWDERRVNNVNQHMISAFLRWRLRGEDEVRRYLEVATPRAADGGYTLDSDLRGSAGPDHWPGFAPRSALGLELWHAAAGTEP